MIKNSPDINGLLEHLFFAKKAGCENQDFLSPLAFYFFGTSFFFLVVHS